MKNNNNYKLCFLIAVGFLICASAYDGAPYGFYQILRFVVTIFAAWSAVKVYNKNPQSFWLFVFVAIAILFNPIIKITFEREIWRVIDVITTMAFGIYFDVYMSPTRKL